eukprot:11575928-Ditylum_brightwellii.AAC.1
MDDFLTAKSGSATLVNLNAVRLFLGATSLADICNNDRTCTEPWDLSGSRRARPTIPWPTQERPSEYCWVTW